MQATAACESCWVAITLTTEIDQSSAIKKIYLTLCLLQVEIQRLDGGFPYFLS